VAINFDQILHKKTLSLLQYGVLNAHASKLPADRGISPALWAFARGDPEVWVSLYKMDSGLDTGPIYEQFPVKVEDRDSAFSLYRKVCLQSGEHMARLLKDVIGCRPFLQANSGKVEKPHSWPDDQFSSLLQRNGRQLMKWRDFATILLN
jgi:methionyl-tRNA formyltransferase